MHQPLGGAQGQASDIEIHAREILRMQDKIRQIISQSTGQPYDKVARDSDRDYFLNAEQAVEYGLIDEVLHPPSDGQAKSESDSAGADSAGPIVQKAGRARLDDAKGVANETSVEAGA